MSNTKPYLGKICRNIHRLNTPFEKYFLPTIIAFGAINWPYAFFYKVWTFTFSMMWYYRMKNKTENPEAPETYVREMIHTHSVLGELFKVDTTSTLDFRN